MIMRLHNLTRNEGQFTKINKIILENHRLMTKLQNKI
jgi:hypothetical protein